MQDKNNLVKYTAFALILGLAYPTYLFLGGTIEKKRKNAVANADKPWAPEALEACIWRYEWSMRKEKSYPLYEDWLKMYGGNDVNELVFPDRWAEIQEYGDDTDHKFSPPRISTKAPHKNTAYMLFQYALMNERKRERYKAEE
ncbi:MAG: hypothetical protein P1V97_37180, partial [Planctomycetota bacterium]|nr:hypothetical protein [Planctomycetota bacterium]